MYTAEINRKHPACLIVLIDQSHSMADSWEETGRPKSAVLATAVNNLLGNAVLQCSKGDDRINDYFEVGVIGYGVDVAPALHGAHTQQPTLPISVLARNPLRVDDVKRKMYDGAGGTIEVPVKLPVWVDPVANGLTPMVVAIKTAEQIVSAWCDRNPDSFPPIVINVTDGESTDGDPSAEAARLRAASTNDGAALLFNLHISGAEHARSVFPHSADELVDPNARRLFEMSSVLPGNMAEAASVLGHHVKPGARGFLFNADAATVIEFLDIGTRAVTPTGLKQITGGSDSTS